MASCFQSMSRPGECSSIRRPACSPIANNRMSPISLANKASSLIRHLASVDHPLTAVDAHALRYWVGFNRINGIGAIRFKALLDHFGDLEAAWYASEAELMAVLSDRRACVSVLSARQS